MGLTKNTSKSAAAHEGRAFKKKKDDILIALAGNPNVGKSTVFNSLTGMNQHTGNWSGKTVGTAYGTMEHNGHRLVLVDLPGTYSLKSSSVEEEVARDFIAFGGADVTIIVIDATCIERNLNLVLQILEVTKKAVVCVNLLDEAEKKGIEIDLDELSLQLGVPVAGTSARSGKGLSGLIEKAYAVAKGDTKTFTVKTGYGECIENAVNIITPTLENTESARFIALSLIEGDSQINNELLSHLKEKESKELIKKTEEAVSLLVEKGVSGDAIKDLIVTGLVTRSEEILNKCACFNNCKYNSKDRKLDKLLTSKITGIPVMLMLLGAVFWLTVELANYPSALLSAGFSSLGVQLESLLQGINVPSGVIDFLLNGVYKTLTWVISVMLPPMAIFFPLFTILEDSGYLPRIAFNLDKFFKKANAHGKQSLTMVMGFGCNACGVIGCRIIDTKKERLIAIITNSLVPCNGRLPSLIAIISMFFTAGLVTPLESAVSAVILLAVIVFSVVASLIMSRLLSVTVLKGLPSSFHLELPPYRRPQIGKVIIRSLFDRTLFVLLRAAAVAAPAGVLIYALANIESGGQPLLTYCTEFLDPFARIFGLDGVILAAFILAFPANEIVFPVMLMAYTATGALNEIPTLPALKEVLVSNGWTVMTAVCVMLFVLCHFPCSTTCLTIKKETKSIKWTLVSIVLPTILGLLLCFIASNTYSLLNMIFY